jgi:hypothetical protein
MYKYMADGEFPRSFSVGRGSNAKGWLLSQINEWIAMQAAEAGAYIRKQSSWSGMLGLESTLPAQ